MKRIILLLLSVCGALATVAQSDIYPVILYTSEGLEGACLELSAPGPYVLTGMYDNAVKSLHLRAGNMIVLANNPDGTGHSRCYIADGEDLVLNQLPDGFVTQDGTDRSFVSYIGVWPIEDRNKFVAGTEIPAGHYYSGAEINRGVSVTEQMAIWPAMQRHGKRLVGPGFETPWSEEFEAFYALADSLNYRVDVAATARFAPLPDLGSTVTMGRRLSGGRNLWVMEWSPETPDGIIWDYMEREMSLLDRMEGFERLFYAGEGDMSLGAPEAPTEAGEAFYAYVSGSPYEQEGRIHTWRIAPPLPFMNYDDDYQSITLKWYDHNGETGDNYEVFCKNDDGDYIQIATLTCGIDYQPGGQVTYSHAFEMNNTAFYRIRATAYDGLTKSIWSRRVRVDRDRVADVPLFRVDEVPGTPAEARVLIAAVPGARGYEIKYRRSDAGTHSGVERLTTDGQSGSLSTIIGGLGNAGNYLYKLRVLSTDSEIVETSEQAPGYAGEHDYPAQPATGLHYYPLESSDIEDVSDRWGVSDSNIAGIMKRIPDRYGHAGEALAFGAGYPGRVLVRGDLFGTGDFTLGLWIRTGEGDTEFLRINAGTGQEITLGYDGTGTWRLTDREGATAEWQRHVTPGAWCHVSLTADRLRNTYTLYINGTLTREKAGPDLHVAEKTELVLGGPTGELPVGLDDLQIVAGRLGEPEIRALMNGRGELSVDETVPDGSDEYAIYDLTGRYCGTDIETLAPGLYVRAGKKLLITK